MRHHLPILVVLLLLAAWPAQAEPKQSASLLTVGNSFTVDSTGHLAALAKAGGKELSLLNMIKGGCSLQQHAEGLQAAETAPDSAKARIYKAGGNHAVTKDGANPWSLPEALEVGNWDYISIHQYSLLSFKPETYEPYAGQLVKFLQSRAPKSEILIHESWAYREDDPLFQKNDGFTSDKMHEALKAAYAKMAADHHLRIVPIGDAFQAARKTPEWTFKADTAFDYANPAPGSLPKDTGSLNVGWIWKKPAANTATPDVAPDNAGTPPVKSGKFTLDAHHANTAGDYLGSCVWYEVIFEDDVTKVNGYTPNGLTPEQAASLRQIAHDTVSGRGSL